MPSDETDRPRDPETGRFLPSGAASRSDSAERATRDTGPAGETDGARPAPVFVTNPNGYPRPMTVYLPALPWLRIPAARVGHVGFRPA